MASILAAAGIPTAVLGFLVWQLKRRIEHQEARQEAAEKAREEFETNLYETPSPQSRWEKPPPKPCSASRTHTVTAICTPPSTTRPR